MSPTSPTPTISFSRKSPVEGESVILRPVSVVDVPVLHAGMADVELAKLTGSVHSLAETAEQTWSVSDLEEVYSRWASADDRMVWAIIEKASGKVVGESVLNDFHPGNRSCGFRIWISGARDKGLGTEATRLTMRHAFEERGVHRVELEVYDFNPRARRVYEKVGFVHEGVKRQALRFEDEWIDAHIMSILTGEWAKHRGHPSH